MASKNSQDKRLNRATGLGDVLGRAMDPVFQKRGFASRDIVAHWTEIAPEPYNRTSVPDQLKWPRGQSGEEGAILFLRCAPGQGFAIAHEAERIAAAVNRYFGYVLVGSVKLSATPLETGKADTGPQHTVPSRKVVEKVDGEIAGIEDEGVREALRRFGEGLLSRREK